MDATIAGGLRGCATDRGTRRAHRLVRTACERSGLIAFEAEDGDRDVRWRLSAHRVAATTLSIAASDLAPALAQHRCDRHHRLCAFVGGHAAAHALARTLAVRVATAPSG